MKWTTIIGLRRWKPRPIFSTNIGSPNILIITMIKKCLIAHAHPQARHCFLSLPSNSSNSTCLPLPLDLIWPFPFITSTSNPPKLASFSWKLSSRLFYKTTSNVGVEFFGQSKYHPQSSKWGVSHSLKKSL